MEGSWGKALWEDCIAAETWRKRSAVRRRRAEAGDSIPGRDKNAFKGPEVGKTPVYGSNQKNVGKFSTVESVHRSWANFQAHPARKWRTQVCAFSCPPCFQDLPSAGCVCLRKEVRMDHLSGLRRLGLGWQDVECVYFLFILEVYFPANTRLTATHILQGSQRQHSIAHEQSCKNKSISSMQP